jgi:hypothetical protein
LLPAFDENLRILKCRVNAWCPFNSLWYQIYTSLPMALMALLILIASIEIRKSPCGYYTTIQLDSDNCVFLFFSATATVGPFRNAFFMNMSLPYGDRGWDVKAEGKMSVLFLNGGCFGDFFAWKNNIVECQDFPVQFCNTTD